MKKIKYLILGAGITGLSLAYHLKGQEYALYEMDNKVGGMCKTENVDGFLFDYGEHFIRVDNGYVRRLIKKLLQNNVRSQSLNSAIYSEGRLTNYPFQTNLYGLPLNVVKKCLVGYVNALCAKKQNEREEINNFEQWIYTNFGEGIAEYFMIPYNEKIWTLHPRYMTTEWFFSESIVPKGSLELVIEGALRQREVEERIRWYPARGGIESLAKSFLRFINNVHLNKRAMEINSFKRKVTFEDGEVVQYEHLLNTIPLPELIGLISDLPSGIKKTAANLKHNSVICVNLGVDRKNLSDRHWIYFPENKYIFSRLYFPYNFSSFMVPRGKSSVSAIITYAEWKPIDKGNITERVIHDLVDANILKEEDKIITHSVADVKYGFSLYTPNRTKSVELIKAHLLANNIHTVGRYGNWEYSGIEHAILNSKELAESLQKVKYFLR
jgi:UDP-galactopyranose mutase